MPRRLSLVLALVAALLLAPGLTVARQDPLQAGTRTVNIELILDASGSMAEPLPGGETRIDAAGRILRQVISDLPEREGVNVGLRVYGHKGDNTQAGRSVSCRASDLLVPIKGVDKASLIQQVAAVQPTGWTPIAYALRQAAADFQPGGESITNAIVLVTDGEETCDPPEQSCQAAATLHQTDVAVITHVVGFALTPEQTAVVRCVAKRGGGQIFDADNAEELASALGSAIAATGVMGTPLPLTPVAAPVPLPAIHTLVYHQLTTWTAPVNDRGEEAPLLSDDGQRIAFARAPGTQDPATPNRIFVMNADGAGEREVDAYQTLCFCGSLLDLSADGSRVVSSDGVQLRVADGNGGGGWQVFQSGGINALRISGDGSTIVFRIHRDTAIGDNASSQPIQRGIYAINPDGSGLRQLVGPDDIAPLLGLTPEEVPFFSGSSGLDVSANGGRIVFTSNAEIDPATGSAREGLFAVNGDGAGLHRLLGPAITYVIGNAISGDGTRVAYVTAAGSGLQEAGVVSFDGVGQRTLTDSTSLHPGTGSNLPSGERLQLNVDGSRLLLGSSGVLYDTGGNGQLALGVGITSAYTPLVGDGLYRATMDAGATRLLYLFQPPDEPYQLARLDLNPAALGGAPAIADASVNPPFVLTGGRSIATVSTRVSPVEPAPVVGVRVLLAGLPDPNTDAGLLHDDGTAGDVTANDELFTTDSLRTNCCAEIGPRMVRIKAETQAADGLRHATAIDVGPIEVSTQPVAVSPSTVTPPVDIAATAMPAISSPVTSAAATPAPTAAPTANPQMSPADFVTPDPAECTIAPRSAASLIALSATPDPVASDALVNAMATPTLDIPAGQPADEAVQQAVIATYRQITACFNAGRDLAAYALWTDDALRQMQVEPPSATPTPVPEDARSAFRVTQVLMLSDARVVAVWEERSALRTTTFVQALVRQGDRYVVSETLDAMFA